MAPAALRNTASSSTEDSPLLNDRDSTDIAPSHDARRSLLTRNLLGDGRAVITQAGCLLLLGLVLYSVIQNPAGLFGYHPPLQSLAILLFAQGVLTLQPTSTKVDKARGLAIHQIFQGLGVVTITAGIVIMIINKNLHSSPHFTSWHGKLGLATGILLLLQAVAGLAIVYDPGMQWLGGVGKAKSLWKYHRASGYVILPLSLLTAAMATTSADWVRQHTTLFERIIMTSGLGMVAVGVWSGISLKKLGLSKK